MWQRTTLPPATLLDAVRNLDDVSVRIVLIVNDEGGELVGTVSDGDIRRGLRGLDLRNHITDVVQRNPLVVPDGMSRELILQLMTANKIQQITVVVRTTTSLVSICGTT